MTIRERIVEKVQNLPERALHDVYEIVERIEAKENGPGLLERLNKIRISAPPDFSENFDLYASGEKNFDEEMDKIGG